MTSDGDTTSRNTLPQGISFRKHETGDIKACGRLARQAWPAGPGKASKDVEQASMEGYMQYSLDSSNWADIACADGRMIGFLFGRIDGLRAVPERSHLGEIPSLSKSILEYDRRDLRLLAFIWSLALTELKLKLNTPPSDASVEMFIVDSEWRGKGVGSTLLDRFLKAAEGAGAGVVTVYTDDLMSDWRFYERRGFGVVATFHDNITSYYSGSKARGLIFSLVLARQAP